MSLIWWAQKWRWRAVKTFWLWRARVHQRRCVELEAQMEHLEAKLEQRREH